MVANEGLLGSLFTQVCSPPPLFFVTGSGKGGSLFSLWRTATSMTMVWTPSLRFMRRANTSGGKVVLLLPRGPRAWLLASRRTVARGVIRLLVSLSWSCRASEWRRGRQQQRPSQAHQEPREILQGEGRHSIGNDIAHFQILWPRGASGPCFPAGSQRPSRFKEVSCHLSLPCSCLMQVDEARASAAETKTRRAAAAAAAAKKALGDLVRPPVSHVVITADCFCAHRMNPSSSFCDVLASCVAAVALL